MNSSLKGSNIIYQDVGIHRQESYWSRSLRTLLNDKGAVLGAIVVIVIVLGSILAPNIAPYDPISQDLPQSLKPPSRANLLGTDQYGRDILSRILWGGRSSIRIGFISVIIGCFLGSMMGLFSGFSGGLWDTVLMRVVDAMLGIPIFLLALIVIATVGPGEANVIIAVAISTMPRFARMVRADALVLKEQEYLVAAQAAGGKKLHMLWKHVFPGTIPTITVLFTIYIANAILIEASLGFLGLGTQPPSASWGLMVSSARGFILVAPWAILFPSLTITLMIMGLNLLGDGMRDALDVRLS